MSNFEPQFFESYLFIDFGNTAIKAVFLRNHKWELFANSPEEHYQDFFSRVVLTGNMFKKFVLSSVKKDVSNRFISRFGEDKCVEISVGSIPANLIDYTTPQTLGIDRFLACYGACKKVGKAVVVIDAGTACTIDFMNADCVFAGGVITPGLSTLLSAFEKTAPALPKVPIELPSQWPGKSTKESLQWGQIGLFLDGLKGSLLRYKDKYGEFVLFLTGGDAAIVLSLLQREAIIDPMLVFEGMLEFLKTNN